MQTLHLPFAGDPDVMSFVTLCRREQRLRDRARAKREAEEAAQAHAAQIAELDPFSEEALATIL